MTTPTDAELRAAWDRVRPELSAKSFEEAMRSPALAIVIRAAAVAFARPAPPSPTPPESLRELPQVLSTRSSPRPWVKAKQQRAATTARPDAKQRQANDLD